MALAAEAVMNSSENARAILGALQPLTGAAATGKLFVRSTGATGIVPAGAFAIPKVGDSICEDATVFVKRSSAADYSWAVTSLGTLVDVEALGGGTITNQSAGTEYRWDPPLSGIEATSESHASYPLAGGTLSGLLKQVRSYKNAQSATYEEFIRAQLSTFPGAILAWESTAPASGTLGPAQGPRGDRRGRDRILYRATWILYLVTSRLESEAWRRRESDLLRDAVTEELFGRELVRTLHVSSSPGLEIVTEQPFAVTPAYYADLVRFGTTFVVERKSGATGYNDWMRSRIAMTEPASAPLLELTRVDTTVPMTDQSWFDRGFDGGFHRWPTAT